MDVPEFVDIHGRDVKVVILPNTGEIVVPLSELRNSSFALYRKSQYDKLLVDESDFTNDFNVHVLKAAQKYIFTNKVGLFKEQEILASIDNCKKLLLKHTPELDQNSFLKNRSVCIAGDEEDVKITSTVVPQKRELPLTTENVKAHNEKAASVPVSMKTSTDGESQLGFHSNQQKTGNWTKTNNQNDYQSSPSQRSYGFQQKSNSVITTNQGQSRNSSDGPLRDAQEGRSGQIQNRSSFQGQQNRNSFQGQQRDSFQGQRRDSFQGQQRNDFQGHKRDGFQNQRDGGFQSHRDGFQGQERNSFQGQHNNSFQKPPTDTSPGQPRSQESSSSTLRPPRAATVDNTRRIKLNSDEVYEVVVSFITEEKPYVVWVQDKSNAISMLTTILEKAQEEGEEGPSVPPAMGKDVLAQEDGMWFRSVVVGLTPLQVFFVDYGNKSNVDEVKPISAELAKFPYQAVRLALEPDQRVELEDSVKVLVKKQFDDGTYSATLNISGKINNGISTTVPATTQVQAKKVEDSHPPVEKPRPKKTFFTLPPCISTLENNQTVLVIGEAHQRLFLRTKECVMKLKDIKTAIETVAAEPLDSVSKGQLVLSPRNVGETLLRAVVSGVDGNSVTVTFLDYPDKATCPLSLLKAITEELSREPTTFFESLVIDGCNEAFNEEAKSFIAQLVSTRTKLQTVVGDNSFDLTYNLDMGSTIHLSAKLNEFKKDGRVRLVDLPKITLNKGPGDYLVYLPADFSSVTVMPYIEPYTEHLARVICPLEACTTPYKPVVGEVCMGIFEGSWYRCAVKEIIDQKFKVLFIDFGNFDVLSSEQLSKFSDDLKDVPALGVRCRLMGIPQNDHALKLVRDIIGEGENFTVDVISQNEDKYDIEIKSLCDSIKEQL